MNLMWDKQTDISSSFTSLAWTTYDIFDFLHHIFIYPIVGEDFPCFIPVRGTFLTLLDCADKCRNSEESPLIVAFPGRDAREMPLESWSSTVNWHGKKSQWLVFLTVPGSLWSLFQLKANSRAQLLIPNIPDKLALNPSTWHSWHRGCQLPITVPLFSRLGGGDASWPRGLWESPPIMSGAYIPFEWPLEFF
jgi:hypothetical protein